MSPALKIALIGSVIALAAMAPSAAASDQSPGGCAVPASLGHPLMEREGGLAHYVSMPEPCLKTMYLHCSAASEREVLGQHAMMVCSLGHEALLQRVFGGDLDALLAWWRDHREPRTAD